MSTLILIDMDGVIVDFVEGFNRMWRKKHPQLPFVPSEEHRKFYIRDNYPKDLHPLIDEIYYTPGFYPTCPPVPDSIEAIRKIIQSGHEVFICTTVLREEKKNEDEKREWIDRYFGQRLSEKIIFAKDKTLVKGDLLIDDKPKIEGGNPYPSWKHIIFDQPYNREVRGPRISWRNFQNFIPIQEYVLGVKETIV